MLAASTLARRLAAIRAAHRAEGHPAPESPELALVWAGIRRSHGAPPSRKRGLRSRDLKKVLGKLPALTLAGQRDRTLLLLGFAGVLRRSELAALEVSSAPKGGRGVRVVFVAGGLELHFGRTKGDQEGRGAVVAIPETGRPTCPVAALRLWLKAAQIRDGRVFRTIDRHGRMGGPLGDRAVAEIVKRSVAAAGFDPDQFAGHSLRRGGLTSAAEGGAATHELMRHARHARVDTTMVYLEEAHRMKSSAAGKMGL